MKVFTSKTRTLHLSGDFSRRTTVWPNKRHFFTCVVPDIVFSVENIFMRPCRSRFF